MPRPFCRRRVGWQPERFRFFPEGPEPHPSDLITLKLDELEAIRLADLEGLYQEQAAEKMQVSRPTFARILESGRKKVAEALVYGKGLVIEGGPVEIEPQVFRSGHEPGCPGGRRGPFGRRRGCIGKK